MEITSFKQNQKTPKVCAPPKSRCLPTLPPQSLPLKYSSTREPRQACTPRETKERSLGASLQTSFRTGTKTAKGRKLKRRDQEREMGTAGGRGKTSDVYCNTQNLHYSTALKPSLPPPSQTLPLFFRPSRVFHRASTLTESRGRSRFATPSPAPPSSAREEWRAVATQDS